jgi:imidazoleglycerol-phosphate dehydratase
MEKLHGYNSHHIAEAAFKSFSKSLRVAIEKDPRNLKALPSTKGAL